MLHSNFKQKFILKRVDIKKSNLKSNINNYNLKLNKNLNVCLRHSMESKKHCSIFKISPLISIKGL